MEKSKIDPQWTCVYDVVTGAVKTVPAVEAEKLKKTGAWVDSPALVSGFKPVSKKGKASPNSKRPLSSDADLLK